MRIDLWLVANGHASSRQKAQELVSAGRVFVIDSSGKRTPITKASTIVNVNSGTMAMGNSNIDVLKTFGPEYVSRGGEKLAGAIKKVPRFSPQGATVLDVGISTGGFTDCLLQQGASRVVGLEVGHGQLAAKLAQDPRVKLLEGVNAREIGAPDSHWREKILTLAERTAFSHAVIDVSFISLKLILPAVVTYLEESGQILALVKPQFEVGREGLGKGGIVKDPKQWADVETSIRELSRTNGLQVEDYFESPILGADGNREFFAHLKRKMK